MAECETCGDDVASLWEYRVRSASMTHRRSRWMCADCHPYLPDAPAPDSSAEAATTDEGAGPARARGE